MAGHGHHTSDIEWCGTGKAATARIVIGADVAMNIITP
jgi:hypothetical protein